MFIMDPGFGINTCAFLVSLGSVLLLLGGVKDSKSVTNFFSSLNVFLVFFMAFMSLLLAKKENLTPFIPPQFGAGGVIRGATSSFFGYIGFDGACTCMRVCFCHYHLTQPSVSRNLLHQWRSKRSKKRHTQSNHHYAISSYKSLLCCFRGTCGNGPL